MIRTYQHPTRPGETATAFHWDRARVAFYERPGWVLINEVAYSGPVPDITGIAPELLERLAEVGYTTAAAAQQAADSELRTIGLSWQDIRAIRNYAAPISRKRKPAQVEADPGAVEE